jgi:D-tyrosyl-tRNA(Tyr) deacylase
MNLSVNDVGGGVLVVSNFTLAANYAKGNRPDYLNAAHPTVAEPLYEHFVALMRERVPSVATGVFGADMKITMTADGPVTIVMDSRLLRKGGRV